MTHRRLSPSLSSRSEWLRTELGKSWPTLRLGAHAACRCPVAYRSAILVAVMPRDLDRRSFLQALAGTALGGLGSNSISLSRHPPNIAVIMADDMRFSDIGSCRGEIATPNFTVPVVD